MPFKDEIADATLRAMELYAATTDALVSEVARRRAGDVEGLHWKEIFGRLPRRELWDPDRCIAVVEATMQGGALRVTGYLL